MKRCVECNRDNFEMITKDHRVQVSTSSWLSITIPSKRCLMCGRTYVNGVDLIAADFDIAAIVAELNDSNAHGFRAMRRGLKMRRTELAGKLNVTPKEIARWEKPGNEPDYAAWCSLVTLVSLEIENCLDDS